MDAEWTHAAWNLLKWHGTNWNGRKPVHLQERDYAGRAGIATAIRLGGGIVATGDPDDLRSLARDHGNVKVQLLS
jgi:hypothetical protein